MSECYKQVKDEYNNNKLQFTDLYKTFQEFVIVIGRF